MTEQETGPEPGQPEATAGEGVQPAELGYAPPDTGQGEGAESEIPVGVDALSDEQIASAQENAPSGEGDEGGDGGALDVSAIVADADDDAEGDAEPPDAEGDAEPPDAEGDAEPPDAEAAAEPPDAEGDAEPPDAEGDAEPPDAEAAAEPPDAEGEAKPADAEAEAEPADAGA